jgi:hypothetical protein
MAFLWKEGFYFQHQYTRKCHALRSGWGVRRASCPARNAVQQAGSAVVGSRAVRNQIEPIDHRLKLNHYAGESALSIIQIKLHQVF